MSKLMKTLKGSKLATAFVATLLAFSVLLTTFSGMAIFVGAEVWDGSTASSFESGTGTEDDPYIIVNGAQLKYLITLGAAATEGKYYKLANDISLNPVSGDKWYEANGLNKWPTIDLTNGDQAFKGHFNGAGHKVFGLYTNKTTDYAVVDKRDTSVAAGLFPLVGGGATIDAVGVEKAYLSITNACTDANANQSGFVGALIGAFCGNSNSAKIQVTRSYAADTVSLVGAFVGLIGGHGVDTYVDQNDGLTKNVTDGTGVLVTNCYSLLSWKTHRLEDENNRAGLLGNMGNSAVFSGCFAIGNVAGTNVVKGEKNNYVTAWSSSAGSVVDVNSIYGGDSAKESMPDLDWENVYMVTSTHPILRVFNVEATEGITVWDGTQIPPSKGTGTEADPFVIETAENLAYVVANGGGAGLHYVLANDIYLNDVAMVNWTNGQANGDYTPNAWFGSYNQDGASYADGKVFKGTLDGAGFTVSGLYYKPGDANTAAALIPVANGATVKNLRLKNSFISGGRWTAGVLGYSTNVVVENVVVDKDVTVWAYNAGNKYTTQAHIDKAAEGKDAWPVYGNTSGDNFQSCGAATVVGYAITSIKMTNVATYATLKQEGHTFTTANPLTNGGEPVTVGKAGHNGALIGTAWNTAITVNNAIASFSPFDGSNGSGAQNFTNVYSLKTPASTKYACTVVSEDAIKGESAKANLSGLDFDTTWATTDEYPTLMIFNRMDPTEYWSGELVQPSEGAGTATDPILISTPEELAYIVKNGTAAGAYYKLTKDIYLNDVTQIDWATGTVKTGYIAKSWFTSGTCGVLDGTIDGDGHKVYGLYVNIPGNKAWARGGAGLFPFVAADKSFSVSKLGIDTAYVNVSGAATAFTAALGAKATVSFDQCYVGSNVVLDGNNAAAFIGVGDNTFSLTNCYSLATLKSASTAKGLLGDLWKYNEENGPHKSTLTNCYNANGPIFAKGQSVGTYNGNYATVSSGDNLKAGETVLTQAEMQGLSVVTTGKMSGLGDKFQGTTTYPILAAFAPVKPAPEAGVWDGTTKTAPSVGTGTESDPYMIYNAAELAYVISLGDTASAGKFYKLANDIYINEVDKVNWTDGTAIDGYKINTWISGGGFAGNFDGDGNLVKGLYFKNTEEKVAENSGVGLFNYVKGSPVIKNLGVDYAYVENKHAAAAFVGNNTGATSTTISYCFVGENVVVSGYTSAAFIGVSDKSFHLDHVYNLGTLKKNTHQWKHYQTGEYEPRNGITGLYGDTWGANPTSIKNAYNATGPISDRGTLATKSDIFCIGGADDKAEAEIVSVEDMQGLTVFNNNKPMQKLNVDKAWQATNKFPILDIFSENPEGNDGEEWTPESDVDEKGIWKGVIAETFSDNTSKGTKDDPIVLATPGELALAIKSGGGGKYYKLANDMYLNDVSSKAWASRDNNNKWLTNGEFSGHIDGAGNIVYGLWYATDATGDVGLVPRMLNGSITNLGIRYACVRTSSGANGVGTLIGWAKNIITIEKCFVDETVTVAGGPCTGVLVGLAQQNNAASEKGLVIRDCYTKTNITASSQKINGLIGNPWITAYEVYDCYTIFEQPYCANNNGGKSSTYWYHTMKYDEEKKTWVQNESKAKDGKNAADYFKDIYTDTGSADKTDHFWTKLDNENMYGTDAAKYMSGLDFTNTWKTNKDGTPTLKIFGDKVDGVDIDMSADAEIYSSGSGKRNDPYIIENAAQLKYLVTSQSTAGKYYKIVNDIYINDTTAANWKTNAAVWPTDQSSSAFAGHLEGDGHSIYGIYINQTPTPASQGGDYVGGSGAGLFSYAYSGATIRNIHIRDSYISGRGNVGAIIGHTAGNAATNVTVTGCSVDESVVLRGFTVGGIIGTAFPAGVNIYFSYVTADIDGNAPENRTNTFIGDAWSNKCGIMNSYSIGRRPVRGSLSGQTGAIYSDISAPNFTVVPKANMYGAGAKSAMPDLKWDVVWYTANGKTPQLKVVGEDVYPYDVDEGVKGRVWSGKLATKFAGGSGTKEDPYLIETPEQLAYFVNLGGSTNNTYYKITADIKLNDTSKPGWEQKAKEWLVGTPSFSGHLDGGYHVITGLYINRVDASPCGLISQINSGASISRLGVAASSITNEQMSGSYTYASAFAGFIEGWDGYMGANWDGTNDKAPIYSECFVAPDVTITAATPGGLLGGGAAGVKFYNCFACPTLNYTYRGAGLYGDLWESNEGWAYIENCYVATTDRDPMGTGPKYSASDHLCKNAYVDGAAADCGVTGLNLFYMQGERAKEHMPGLNYSKTWKIVTRGETGGTPVLRGFANCEKYSNTREPMKVSIEFVTGDGGSKHEPVWGYPMVTEVPYDEFPVPERYGYKFDGWYHFDSCDLEFNLEYFPNYNCYAYAKWVQVGFTNGFEGNNSNDYDINEGCEFFQPGVSGYNPKYIHGGLRSLHTLPDSSSAPMFLLGYETKLEVGTTYDINFWMASKENGAAGTIDVIHSNYADVNDEVIGTETGLEFTDLKGGEWKQYRITVTANGPYLMFRTTPGVELFFDDFQVVPIDEEGEVGILDGFNPGGFGEPIIKMYNDLIAMGIVGIIILIVLGLVLVVGAVVVVLAAILIIVKVSKKKKAKKLAAAAAAAEVEAPADDTANQ